MADGKRQTDCSQQKRGIIEKSNGTAPYSDHQLVKPVCFQRLALRKRRKRRDRSIFRKSVNVRKIHYFRCPC